MAEPLAKFTATLYKIQTLSEGGGRIALDFPSTELPKLSKLFQISGEAILLTVVLTQQAVDPRFYNPDG